MVIPPSLLDAPPEEVLGWALQKFPRIALACSFGAEDLVLVHMASSLKPGVDVFYLDTHLHFPETYATRDIIRARYPITLHRVEPELSLTDQEALYGPRLWERDPDLCCRLRKVEPLKRFLKGYDAWITGIRREQAPTRARAQSIQFDAAFSLWKINPLVAWRWEDVWDYIRSHQIPYHPLHDRHYPSIGCLPCTTPVRPGEDLRSGRWRGKDKKECGLHA